MPGITSTASAGAPPLLPERCTWGLAESPAKKGRCACLSLPVSPAAEQPAGLSGPGNPLAEDGPLGFAAAAGVMMATPLPAGLQSRAGRVAVERRGGLSPKGEEGRRIGELAFSPWLSPTAPLGSARLREDRRKKGELDVLEIPSIPNPFPELCCSQFTSVLSASLLPKANPRIKQVIKIYSEDETSRSLEVPSDITARDLCQLLILKNHYVDDHSWTMFEHLACLGLERIIEDHERMTEIQSKWGIEEGNRFYFRKNYAKYEFFKNPENFFPEYLISFSNEISGAMSHTQILQMFLSSSTYPEIHSYLHAKEQGKKTWKKMYFLLRRSGLYFSTKGTSKILLGQMDLRIPRYSKMLDQGSPNCQPWAPWHLRRPSVVHPEPRHLQLFSEFSSSDIYMSLTGKKVSGVPASYGFCFKHHKAGGARDLKQLYADSEQSRTCWVTAIRLLKYGMQLYQNYMQPYQGRSGCISLSTPVKKGCLRLGVHSSPTTLQNVSSNIAIHSAQLWFHHKISREEAHQLILRQGLVDGVFLVRDSQSNPRTFVLSLSHGLKIKHFQIVPLEEEGKLFYTLDDGHTRFSDLIQLVEFYQLNKGILPCKLKHYCARIAL
ncbi:growth factor receptor-bound protein 14 isoform X2 [Rhineura floridana]|uniref:growth factor receptor-bound protein 14 isoform X2 n=1 Tax=Rhineura floridana TaxID=261503 RepID=UPI002AC87D95|nr:growth factor receptor-bound protein 14 isoform X2 [Rhineura floridana]